MILYFSATGNCKYVAKRLAKEFHDVALSIEEANISVHLDEGEMLGIVTPVYYWELPILTRDFLKELKINKSGDTYSYIVTTYGTTPGCTYEEAKKILMAKGLELNAGYSIKMPDTWTPQFDVSNEEEIAKQNDDAEQYIDNVIAKIRDRQFGNKMEAKRAYAVRLMTDPLYNMARKTKNFYVEPYCIGCEMCAKRCPTKAIDMKDGRPVWSKNQCALCFRCLHHCPTFAIQYGNGMTKLHGQYTNPKVSV